MLSAEGLKPDPQKVAAIRDMNPPRDKLELETVLGMINFLARFGIWDIAYPSNQASLILQSAHINITEACIGYLGYGILAYFKGYWVIVLFFLLFWDMGYSGVLGYGIFEFILE